MRQLLWITASLMGLLLIWTACSKSNSSNNSNSPTTLLTKAVWKYDTSGFDLNADGKIDYPDTLAQPCFKDNTYQFNKDSTVVVDEGPIKCNSSDPQTATYSWTMSSSTPPVLKSDANPVLANGVTVQVLNSTQLEVYKDTSILGISIRYILSMKH